MSAAPTTLGNVHPFPARMAPELIESRLARISAHSVVLDPMVGSGSFVVAAAREGHKGVGVDSDPLAVLIATAALGQYDHYQARAAAKRVLGHRCTNCLSNTIADQKSLEFIDYWFDGVAQSQLASLACGIRAESPSVSAPLWCGFSRLIITKDSGASRARDVSHSRPHVVRASSSFNPHDRFLAAVETVISRSSDIGTQASIIRGDARCLPIASGSVDHVMTSPPYLNAIDYLRGHRLSLVWMGYSVLSLRDLRGTNVGSERGGTLPNELRALFDAVVTQGVLKEGKRAAISRYLHDLQRLASEWHRVLKMGGTVTTVVANSSHGSATVSIDLALEVLLVRSGFEISSIDHRDLPAGRRYLPPPSSEKGALDARMRRETILEATKAR